MYQGPTSCGTVCRDGKMLQLDCSVRYGLHPLRKHHLNLGGTLSLDSPLAASGVWEQGGSPLFGTAKED
jgi:hypothetical protein